MSKLRKVRLDNCNHVFADTVVTDYSTPAFISYVAYNNLGNAIASVINNGYSCHIEGIGYYRLPKDRYAIEKRRSSNSDFVHVIAYAKDDIEIRKNGEEVLHCYLFYKNDEEKLDRLYDKIYENTAIPILREWMPYLLSRLVSTSALRYLNVYYNSDALSEPPFYAASLNVHKSALIRLISAGLAHGDISICEGAQTSELMAEIEGLDRYLNTFGEILARKIQESFVPKFIPGESSYCERLEDFDDECYSADIELFDAQKAVMQATINNLRNSDYSFIIGEMGSGKTAIACGITYAFQNNDGYNTIVLCPSHLTNKWKREIERLVPNSEAHIVHNVSDIIELMPKMKAKKKNLYIIVSKETAKLGYELRPCAIWSNIKNTFVCPDCGGVLSKKSYVGTGRRRHARYEPFTMSDMAKQRAYNLVCENNVKKWNDTTKTFETKTCGAKLWVPVNKDDQRSKWIKLGTEGWFMLQHLVPLRDELINRQTRSRGEDMLLAKLTDTIGKIRDSEDEVIVRAPKKYPLAKYINKYCFNLIDFLIADEIHQYKGDTYQGQAFDDLTKCSKKTICLTGTLLNGYADGLFYILYRTMPSAMIDDGFKYSDEASFLHRYGVVKRSSRFSVRNGSEHNRIGGISEKKLPGVSPLVFTKYLLDNAAFLSLSDMAEGLVPYTEIPIGIDMDRELAQAYSTLEGNLRRCVGWHGRGGIKAMGAMLQTLSVYPDMPYDQPDILHPETGEVLVTPPTLGRQNRNKEQELLDIVQRKVDAGERVLIYYSWTNKSDAAEKLSSLLSEYNISNAVMESNISPEKREKWIENAVEAGSQVIICNPALVETGLDLLDFTTIIFYQIGYNIFTLRQASRRSWRLSQTRPIEVYFLYYKNTIQEQALSLMATKLQASMAIEGKFSEEGLRAMSNNEDLLTQIANSVISGIKHTVDADVFKSFKISANDLSSDRSCRRKNVIVDDFAPSFLIKSRKRASLTKPTNMFIRGLRNSIVNEDKSIIVG